jgi:hypothetical protein
MPDGAPVIVSDGWLHEQAERLVAVPGVLGVLLGGSRARGEHTPESDVDLGVYYRAPLDVDTLGALARDVAGPAALVTAVGEWGPWVDGGAWLQVDGVLVDWLYRDLDRVATCWADAQQGRYRFHTQVGHPLGVPDFAYAGEVALGVVLADPTGQLTELHEAASAYPPALSEALISGLWEARFLIDAAEKAVSRGDAAYVAGCLFRALGLCAHALHGRAGRWLINEKGAVASAGRLPGAPEGFAQRTQELFGSVGSSPDELTATLDRAAALVDETFAACAS